MTEILLKDDVYSTIGCAFELIRFVLIRVHSWATLLS